MVMKPHNQQSGNRCRNALPEDSDSSVDSGCNFGIQTSWRNSSDVQSLYEVVFAIEHDLPLIAETVQSEFIVLFSPALRYAAGWEIFDRGSPENSAISFSQIRKVFIES